MGYHKQHSQRVCYKREFEKIFMLFIDNIGVWLLTTGLNTGVSSVIGHCVRRYRLLNKKSYKPTLIGLTGWGTVTENTRDVVIEVGFIIV